MSNDTILVKAQDVRELDSSSKERATNEDRNPPPPQHSFYILKEGSDEKIFKNHPPPSFRRSGKPINHIKRKKTNSYTSSKESLICHCCRKRGHRATNYWYS